MARDLPELRRSRPHWFRLSSTATRGESRCTTPGRRPGSPRDRSPQPTLMGRLLRGRVASEAGMPQRGCACPVRGGRLTSACFAGVAHAVSASASRGRAPGGAPRRASEARFAAALTSRSSLAPQAVQSYSRIDRGSLAFTAPQAEHVLLDG